MFIFLTVSTNEESIVTGGADSMLVRWKDVTQEKKAAAIEERETLTLQEQQLANFIHSDELLQALRLALRLQRPHQSLKIIQGLFRYLLNNSYFQSYFLSLFQSLSFQVFLKKVMLRDSAKLCLS